METIKIEFHPSTTDKHQGTISYHITHNNTTRLFETNYRLSRDEWNKLISDTVSQKPYNDNNNQPTELGKKATDAIKQMQSIITRFSQNKCTYTSDDTIDDTFSSNTNNYLFVFMNNIIKHHKSLGKIRTAETYTSVLHSFLKFRNNKDILLKDISSDIILLYESYLHNKGLTRNTSSFYMRNLRAIYNIAVEKELTIQQRPFKHVYTGIDKTIKRAIPLKTIKQIKSLDLSLQPSSELARDMFLFSFYTRGMSFIDMAYLKKKDLSNGTLSYRRRKTGQRLLIRWEKCMQEITEKYNNPFSEYLLPIIKPTNEDKRKQYQNSMCIINRQLKKIGKMINLQIPLTMYVARHSWASAAKSKKIPISVISEGMGHNSELTTQIYLSSLDASIIDNANKLILNEL